MNGLSSLRQLGLRETRLKPHRNSLCHLHRRLHLPSDAYDLTTRYEPRCAFSKLVPEISINAPSGQPPQRPPSLGPPSGLGAGAFRAPFPQYGLPPRNVMPGFASLTARQQQVPGNFTQQRGSSNFPFSLQQQQQPAPSLPTPSTANSSELGLDPNDFPALGSTTGSASASNAVGAPSYATQAGVTSTPATQPAQASQQQRDFTPDDFPALGGQQGADGPPGLNGFQQTPGLLNIAQARGAADAEKQRVSSPYLVAHCAHPHQGFTLKSAAWSSPSTNNPQAPQNGINQQQPTYPDTPQDPSPALSATPAHQVLVSAADRWGLLGLIELIKNTDASGQLLSVGTDLATMGMDVQHPGALYATFITPWADQSAAHQVEPDFHVPPPYLTVNTPAPGPAKAAAFSDETLMYMFYSTPRDAMQEVAAQEL